MKIGYPPMAWSSHNSLSAGSKVYCWVGETVTSEQGTISTKQNSIYDKHNNEWADINYVSLTSIDKDLRCLNISNKEY
jgi:hypothetical protein